MSAPTAPGERALPPVSALCVASMALVVASGIDLAAHLPAIVPLGLPTGLVIGGGVLFIAALATLARIRPFAWARFFLVARYALLAYVVIGGLLAYVFVNDGTRGGALALLLASLVVFALDVPVILAFTVARYQSPDAT